MAKKSYFDILDGAARVELLDTFGDDLTVVNTARVNVTAEKLGDSEKHFIRALTEKKDILPFFHPQVRMRMKMPVYLAREWFRLTAGMTRSEVLYGINPECYTPPIEYLYTSKSTEQIENAEEIHTKIKTFNEQAIGIYNLLLELNLAPEVACSILPQSTFTEFIETGSLMAYAHVCSTCLELPSHIEIQEYATAISKLLQSRFPVSWAALNKKEDSV